MENRNQDFNSEPIGNDVDRKEIKKISLTTKCYFSNMFSPINRVGNGGDDIIRRAFENLETWRGPYLLLELLIFCLKIKFYLMTNPLKTT